MEADDESFLYGDDDDSNTNNATEAPSSREVTQGANPDQEEESQDVGDEAVAHLGPDAEDSSNVEAASAAEVVELDEEEGEDEEEDDDSDDDDVQITIDQDKIEEAKTSMQTFGLNKQVRPSLPADKKGKFAVEEFDKVGTINGTPAHELELESLDDKPWRKPGADLTDYFNYGFTEDTWQAYCARQKRLRVSESGVGLPGPPGSTPHHNQSYNKEAISTTNPFNKPGGSIPTLGGGTVKQLTPMVLTSGPGGDNNGVADVSNPPPPVPPGTGPAPIVVMTSDKRAFSKKVFETMDFSVPPPGLLPTPTNVPPPTMRPEFQAPPPPHAAAFDGSTHEDYEFYGYEPTQESQWVAPPSTYEGGGPPPNSDAPPGDTSYDDKRGDVWERSGSASRRTSRETPPISSSRDHRSRDYDRERRSRKRSRSRSRERSHRDYRESRDRDRDSRRDRDRDRDRDSRSDRRKDRSRSRSPKGSKSPGGHKHKKSKKDKKDKEKEKEIKKEIKREPEDVE